MDPNESKPHHYLANQTIPSQLLSTISHTQIFPMSQFNDLSPYTYTGFDKTAAAEQSLNHERRLKRLTSNRESARRSRMRKKKQIQELQHEVEQLYVANNQLSGKLIQMLEVNQQILQGNAQLKERVSSLQVTFADLIDVTF
ncbi:basic leucine zipper 43-like [Rosa rugosa]|uniref:basic leucine zipper 43-like n=1 Tax=Rosa rugosa TaxID=74645 RepID=UPI002B4138F6|nr:basic leucine zipper 43-like [Rosa rugosa]